jgi:hypothetical protein
MNANMLKQWLKDNDTEQRTINNFWERFEAWRNEDDYDFDFEYGEMDTRLIELEIQKIQFTYIIGYDDFIYVILDIDYNGESIGRFQSVYTLDGEYEDDSLKFDNSDYIRLLVETTNKSIEIAKNALKEGIPQEVVAIITGLGSSLVGDIQKSI